MKKILLLFSIILVSFLMACNTDSDIKIYELKKNVFDDIPNTGELSADILDLKESDARTVANVFIKNDKTRGAGNKSIKNVVPIPNKNNSTAIYAVNFNEGGYILISATTKYYPVLAVVEQGTYQDIMPETGQDILIKDMIAEIDMAKDNKSDLNINYLWNKYRKEDTPVHKGQTRAAISLSTYLMPQNNYEDALNDFYSQQSSGEGEVRIFRLYGSDMRLPDGLYEKFVRAAQDEDLWEGSEYEWNYTAYVVERTTESRFQVGPLLTTNWNQNDTFSYDGNDMGCVTIATAQIMKFFEFPTNYEWNKMPNNVGSDELRAFLAQLKRDLHGSDGRATINDAERVLKNFGYSVSQSGHDSSKVFYELKNNRRPVYARGQKNISSTGHAWVIDGLYYSTHNVCYTLYRLADTSYPLFRYEPAEAIGPHNEYSDLTTFHINWGWGGSYNGWFQDIRNIKVTVGTGEVRDYSYGRKELFISKP
jgi:hypothetical protein bfra3_23100